MTKKEAIEAFVQNRFSPVPTEWVRIVAETHNEYVNLPMWGTMWQLDDCRGKRLMQKAHVVDVDLYPDDDMDMNGEHNVLDKDGNPTAVYVYEIDGQYLIGVNGAGWNFYVGVWDMLYDLFGMCWHEEEKFTLRYVEMAG
jgi:hypothetical protein